MVTLRAIETAAEARGLILMGALHEAGTIVLLGAGPGFWEAFRAAPEGRDGAPDPVDRWSTRVIGALARQFGARARYPFGGPPYEPFLSWAAGSGRAFQSPVGMLVHDAVGLMISYRGALHLPQELPLPAPTGQSPCTHCARPCVAACPVGALSETDAYDVPACHAFLDTPAGGDCMGAGCAVRRACPVSRGAGRSAAQSAHHMEYFHRPCPAD